MNKLVFIPFTFRAHEVYVVFRFATRGEYCKIREDILQTHIADVESPVIPFPHGYMVTDQIMDGGHRELINLLTDALDNYFCNRTTTREIGMKANFSPSQLQLPSKISTGL